MQDDSLAPQSIEPEVLLAALAEPERLTLYLSRGAGPAPRPSAHEQPEFVRVAVVTSWQPATLQAEREGWSRAAEALGVGPLRGIEAAELLAPPAGSSWAAVAGAKRAALLERGVELLLAAAPELAVFHVNDEFGGGMLLRLQSGLAKGEPRMDSALLEHMIFASLTYRLLVHTGEAIVVTAANDGTWSSRQVFAPHAAVWRRALVSAPAEGLGGLALAGLAEALVWATATRRGREAVGAGAPEVAAVVTEAERRLKPRLTNLLRERPGAGRS